MCYCMYPMLVNHKNHADKCHSKQYPVTVSLCLPWTARKVIYIHQQVRKYLHLLDMRAEDFDQELLLQTLKGGVVLHGHKSLSQVA